MTLTTQLNELPIEAVFEMLEVAANKQYKSMLQKRVFEVKEEMASLITHDDAEKFLMEYKLLAWEKQYLTEHLELLQQILTACKIPSMGDNS